MAGLYRCTGVLLELAPGGATGGRRLVSRPQKSGIQYFSKVFVYINHFHVPAPLNYSMNVHVIYFKSILSNIEVGLNMNRMMFPLKSLLVIPGNQINMLEKALGLMPDAFVPDMEDSIPQSEKLAARQMIADFLPKLSECGIPVIPRVNSVESGLFEGDLNAVVGPNIKAISVGKINSGDDIHRISEMIRSAESSANLPTGQIRLIPWIETAMAVIKAYEICTASKRVVSVAFGAEDFTNDMDIERRDDESEVLYAKNVVCTSAKAAGIYSLDTPFFGFRNPDALCKNVREARSYGFKGKFAIHPAQIEIINNGFSPSSSELKYAQKIVDVYEEAARSGRGSSSLDGKVIDTPVVLRAKNVLKQASQKQVTQD